MSSMTYVRFIFVLKTYISFLISLWYSHQTPNTIIYLIYKDKMLTFKCFYFEGNVLYS